MNIEQTLRSLKQTNHDSLAEKIETEYPVTWNEERIFQQSYRRHLAQNITTEPIKPAERRYTRLAKFAGLAACLLVTIGLSIGVWSKHQKIETRPPQETQTTTITQTETRTETTAQVTAETQTTGKQTEESTKKPETTADPIQTSDRVQPSESAAALLTTAFQTETAASAAPQTDAAEVGTRQTTPLAASAHTALPQTSVTAGIPEQVVPIIAQSTVTETSATQALQTESQATTATQPETTTAATVQATNAPDPEYRYDLLPGFEVVIKQEFTEIFSIEPVQISPPVMQFYTLDSDRFLIRSCQPDAFSTKLARYRYDIYDAETGQHISLVQRNRETFISSCYRKCKLIPQSVWGCDGYYILTDYTSELVWDDGAYTFGLYYESPDQQDLLLSIAECMKPEQKG